MIIINSLVAELKNNESNIDALIRETNEEAGLIVIKDSIKEYSPRNLDMIEREAKLLELLIKDGYFN